MTKPNCQVDSCAIPSTTRGLCAKHYRRLQRHGDVHFVTLQTKSPEQLLRDALDDVDARGCWIPVASRISSTTGYAAGQCEGRQWLLHRLSYEHHVGPIPAGLQIDHLCRNRACFNPEHLEPVTARENILRSPISQAGMHSRASQCPAGHAYTPETTHVYVGRSGFPTRACAICAREKALARYHGTKRVNSEIPAVA